MTMFVIKEHKSIAPAIWKMVLAGDVSDIVRPGQFVQVALPGFYLRRPISVCDWDVEQGLLTLIYKVVGQGTEAMTAYEVGKELDVLSGLGNGFDVDKVGDRPLLIGGGVGLPPMYGLCRTLVAMGKKPTVLAGFASKADIFLKDEVEALGVPFVVTTMDGSAGVKGVVTDALNGIEYDSICTCGPLPMEKAIMEATTVPAQFSFEERMGCGFGACMGCTIKTRNGYKRICKDGPVLDREEIIW